MSFLEKVRKKPQAVKSRYAFAGAMSVTLVIGLFWITSLPARFAEVSDISKTDTKQSNEFQNENSFSKLLEESKNQLGAVVDSIKSSEGDGEVLIDNTQDIKIDTSNDGIQNEYVSQEDVESVMQEEDIVIETGSEVQEPVVPVEALKESRVILIGTSTSQNTE